MDPIAHRIFEKCTGNRSIPIDPSVGISITRCVGIPITRSVGVSIDTGRSNGWARARATSDRGIAGGRPAGTNHGCPCTGKIPGGNASNLSAGIGCGDT